MIESHEFPEGSAALHAFDLDTGVLLRRFARPPGTEPSFLNDVAIDATGAAYVTDTQRALVFRAPFDADSLEVFADLTKVGRPNGLVFDDRGVLFASVPDGIARIDPRTGAASLLPMAEGVSWAWADGIENLVLLGRNGMHRYNNQDHSMLAAMTAVDGIVAGRIDKAALWAVNTEQEYHEERKPARAA